MVRTGARARELERVLEQAGYKSAATRAAPRSADLSSPLLAEVRQIYLTLGGTDPMSRLRPGAWDLAFEGGLLVELDEELHFNRYRQLTLEREWTLALPWRDDYLALTADREAGCLAAGKWGKRWTNPSCEAMFGPAGMTGSFSGGGAPRWKQRALYDAVKDAASLNASTWRLARVSTHDVVSGIRLGDALEGRASVDPTALRTLVESRTT